MRRVILVAAALVACIYTVEATDEIAVVHAAAGISELRISTASGAVTVTAGGADSVLGRAERHAWGRNETDARAALAEITVTDTVIGTAIELAARMSHSRRPLGCSFAVTTPESMALTVTATSSPVTVTGLTGAVNVATSSAPVSVTGTRGSLNLRTSSGRIDLLDTEGEAWLFTRSAPVSVRVHRGTIDLQTSSAPVQCELARLSPTESARLVTSNGSIELWLPADVSARVRCATDRGIITLHGFTPRFDTLTSTLVVAVIGSGASSVELATSNGDITVRARQ